MSRAYYSASLHKFLNDNSDSILGELTRQHQFALEDLQRNAWISQIQILKNELANLPGVIANIKKATSMKWLFKMKTVNPSFNQGNNKLHRLSTSDTEKTNQA